MILSHDIPGEMNNPVHFGIRITKENNRICFSTFMAHNIHKETIHNTYSFGTKFQKRLCVEHIVDILTKIKQKRSKK